MRLSVLERDLEELYFKNFLKKLKKNIYSNASSGHVKRGNLANVIYFSFLLFYFYDQNNANFHSKI